MKPDENEIENFCSIDLHTGEIDFFEEYEDAFEWCQDRIIYYNKKGMDYQPGGRIVLAEIIYQSKVKRFNLKRGVKIFEHICHDCEEKKSCEFVNTEQLILTICPKAKPQSLNWRQRLINFIRKVVKWERK